MSQGNMHQHNLLLFNLFTFISLALKSLKRYLSKSALKVPQGFTYICSNRNAVQLYEQSTYQQIFHLAFIDSFSFLYSFKYHYLNAIATSPVLQFHYTLRWYIVPHFQDHLQTFAPAKITKKSPHESFFQQCLRGLYTIHQLPSLPQFLKLHASDCSPFIYHLTSGKRNKQKFGMFDRAMSLDMLTRKQEYLFDYLDHTPLRQKSTVFQQKLADFGKWELRHLFYKDNA